MLTMSLMFTSVVSAEDSVEIGGKCYCLVEGDLLFYNGGTGHIGMYSGDGKFVDAHPNNNQTHPGGSPCFKTEKAVKEGEIEDSRFDKSATECHSVKTANQAERNAAVAWAKGKIGEDFNLCQNNACDETDEWYCSQLVHCAYKAQGITLGDMSWWITPSEIISDSDVGSESSKSIGSVSSTDSSGSAKNCFNTTDTVYAKGTGFCKNANYNIYVCSHPVSNGASLSGCTSSSVSTDSNGYFTPQPKSLGTFAEGDYDIVVDENGNGKYDSGTDAIDSSVTILFCGDNAHLSDCTCECDEGYKNCDDDWSNGCECSGECCGAGTPNAIACYDPSNPEDGCCAYAGGCYDGTHPPDKCTTCYGGSWHPGWWCEEGECVPEASTFVLLGFGLLCVAGYFRLKRKEN